MNVTYNINTGAPIYFPDLPDYDNRLHTAIVSGTVLSDTQLSTAQKIFDVGMNAGLNERQAMYPVAQSAFESAYWNSNVYKKNNNGYGMKMPGRRKSPYILGPGTPAPANEGGGYYAKFSSIENSAKDFLHWFDYVGGKWSNMGSDEKFVDFLKSKKYFQGTLSAYKAGVDRISDQLDDYIKKNSSPIGGLLLAGLLLFVIAKRR